MGKVRIVYDLFCKAGGASEGLRRAFGRMVEIVGVDIEEQPNYPYRFIKADALTVDLSDADWFWASPPCQAYSTLRNLGKQGHRPKRRLIGPIRKRLKATGKPYVIENVPSAPLVNPVTLCGQYFGLAVRRHRIVEANFHIDRIECGPFHRPCPVAVYGDHPEHHTYKPGSGGYINRAHTLAMAQEAMGIAWMTWKEITQAIPPAYSQYTAECWLKNCA